MLDQSPHLPAKRQRLQPPADEELSERGSSVLSSGEDESEGSSCSDDYEEDDFCSDELPSDGSSGEESDAYISKEEEELAEPYWEHDPEKKWPVWQIDDVRFDSENNATEVSAFCKTDEFGQRLIRASDNYSCLFNGLRVAAQVIGRPDLIPEAVVDQFLADELKEGKDLKRESGGHGAQARGPTN
ncbi:hypothetical protein GQ600_9097 [Phytophthora cactorum]|nr:hypothetical protein GQ600_9097 [Phytophthora cactorum]